MNNSLKSVIESLEGLFDTFNEHFYNGELEKPIITVSPDITSGAYGWCTSWKAWKQTGVEDSDENEGYYEINLCAEHLSRSVKEVCGTLLHEMVHLWNLQNDIKDTSRGGTYHNKKFMEEANKRGLYMDKHEQYGWCITKLQATTVDFINKCCFEGFGIHRTKMTKMEKAKSKSKSSSRKYVCPLCEQSIRATKDIRVLCGACSTSEWLVEMELEGAESGNETEE